MSAVVGMMVVMVMGVVMEAGRGKKAKGRQPREKKNKKLEAAIRG